MNNPTPQTMRERFWQFAYEDNYLNIHKDDLAMVLPFIEQEIIEAERRGAEVSEEIKEKAWKYDQLCK